MCDLTPVFSTRRRCVKSAYRRSGHEEVEIYGRADHWVFEDRGERCSGVAVKDLGRKHGFSDASFYKWRGKFGGMDVSEARRLRELEGENSKLKKLLAEAMLDIESLKVVARGKR